MIYICQACGKIYIKKGWAIKHSMKYGGHYILEQEPNQNNNNSTELTEIKNKINQLSLKITSLERKIKSRLMANNNENWQVQKQEKININSLEQRNHIEVIRELSNIIKQFGDITKALEPVPDSFMNHPSIYI